MMIKKLAETCNKLGMINTLLSKITLACSGDSKFDSNQLNYMNTQRKTCATLREEMGSKSASTKRLLLRFDKLKEEGHQLDCVALTHSCKDGGFKKI